MGLLSLLQKLKRSDDEARILVLGLDNSGKTSILKRLSNESIKEVMPTQGFNVKTLVQNSFKLNVWDIGERCWPWLQGELRLFGLLHFTFLLDIGGQKAIRPYWRNYFDRTDALIYVIDSSDKRRMKETGAELDQLLSEEKLKGVPLMVFANKQDLLNALSLEEIRGTLRLKNISERKWTIQSCSSKTGEGIEEGFHWVMANMRQKCP
ncbi:hypothetical protein ACHAW5_008698 [Stephanodiscus triporus]|uniref:ADP-ribosylation factor-like protein 3 n=1 Tax=Stephanodiscus triporus TaxID=2934178 RepID=A0ABD3NLM9_9STRA